MQLLILNYFFFPGDKITVVKIGFFSRPCTHCLVRMETFWKGLGKFTTIYYCFILLTYWCETVKGFGF